MAEAQAIEWLGALEAEPNAAGQPDIRALTWAIAAGDQRAFTRFFNAWFDTMYAEAARVTGRDESFCLDVVQDAMMRVIRSMKPLETEHDLRRWLRVVVQSCAYDRLRGEARRRRREQTTTPPGEAASKSSHELAARLQWLEGQLRALDDRSTELLLMRLRFGWTLQQIGRAVGQTTGAVDGRLRRLVSRLRRKAREDFDE